jgi:hypothetical protein
MTIRRGGMVLNITTAAHAIAAPVTAIVTVGQWCRRKLLVGMQTLHLAPHKHSRKAGRAFGRIAGGE